ARFPGPDCPWLPEARRCVGQSYLGKPVVFGTVLIEGHVLAGIESADSQILSSCQKPCPSPFRTGAAAAPSCFPSSRPSTRILIFLSISHRSDLTPFVSAVLVLALVIRRGRNRGQIGLEISRPVARPEVVFPAHDTDIAGRAGRTCYLLSHLFLLRVLGA